MPFLRQSVTVIVSIVHPSREATLRVHVVQSAGCVTCSQGTVKRRFDILLQQQYVRTLWFFFNQGNARKDHSFFFLLLIGGGGGFPMHG